MTTDLTFLEKHLGKHSLLESEGRLALQEAIAQLRAAGKVTDRKGKGAGTPWEVKIPPNHSLRFIPSADNPHLKPDIYCRFSGPSDDEWPWKEQALVIRIWSIHKQLSARAEWDSKKVIRLLEQRNWERVIIRIHFDKALAGDPVPLFHLQFGGKPVEEAQELSWFPTQVHIPRLPYHPLDIILACELIVANFFPDVFSKLREDPEWRALVARSQQRILRHYLEICHSVCSFPSPHHKHTLLTRLWNP